MREFRISGSQLRQYTQGLGPQAAEAERNQQQTEAKARLHEMARDLISSSGQIKSGYLRLKQGDGDKVSLTTNRLLRSGQTDAATNLVKQLVKDAYGQNDQVDAALNSYLNGSAKNNKLGTRSFIKLVAELDRATTGQIEDQRLAGALQGRAGSIKTELFAASFRLQEYGGRALALQERVGLLREPGAEPQARRQVVADLIALRDTLKGDYPKMTDKSLRQTASMLQLDVEQNIDDLLAVHCQELGQAMGDAASYQVGSDGPALDALTYLQSMQEEITALTALADQTDYPLMVLTVLPGLAQQAANLQQRFMAVQNELSRDPKAAMAQAGMQARSAGTSAMEQSQAQLTGLSQDRRQGLFAFYEQARSATQAGGVAEASLALAQARWNEQTAAIDAQAQSVLLQLDQHHDLAHAQLEQACAALRQDMVDEAAVARLDAAKAALSQGLSHDRDRLKSSTQQLRGEGFGPPQASLAGFLAHGKWADAAQLLTADRVGPGDLAQLARALDLHAQPDELARFMKALVAPDASSRIAFLSQVLPRGDQLSAQSAGHLACLDALEQMEPGARLALLGSLPRAVGRHNPGSASLAEGVDGQMLRLDDRERAQSLKSAPNTLVSVASPKVDLRGADLRNATLHVEYRKEHSTQAWAPNLKDARLDQARILLDLSDLPRRINQRTGATELNFDQDRQVVSLFGFDTNLKDWELNNKIMYFERHPEASELPEDELPTDLLDTIDAGPPARQGLHTLLTSIATAYPQQRKEVACQLLDLAIQVPQRIMDRESLYDRGPLFQAVRQDPALMADPQVKMRLDACSAKSKTRQAARQALAQIAAQQA